MNYYTEESAKRKWCPMVRFSNETEMGESHLDYHPTLRSNRDNFLGKKDITDACIASKCMMWIWSDDTKGITRQCGYCGLAR